MHAASKALPGGRGLYEVRFHGRGGQGTVVASTLLAEAAFLEGRDVQAFPFFGVERRGAPVVAHTRIGEGAIRLTPAVAHPDAIVVMDPTLLQPGSHLFDSLRPGGTVLVNSSRRADAFPAPPGDTLRTVDGGRIALQRGLGSAASPIVNTVLLGAFAKLTGVVELRSLERAIREKVPSRPEVNIAAADEAYAAMEVP